MEYESGFRQKKTTHKLKLSDLRYHTILGILENNKVYMEKAYYKFL